MLLSGPNFASASLNLLASASLHFIRAIDSPCLTIFSAASLAPGRLQPPYVLSLICVAQECFDGNVRWQYGHAFSDEPSIGKGGTAAS